MLKRRLEQLSLDLENKDLNKIKILIELVNLTLSEKFENTEKEENIEEICRIFWMLSCVIKLESAHSKDFPINLFKNFIDYINNLSLAKERKNIYSHHGIVLVQFLSELANKNRLLFNTLKDKFNVFYTHIGEFTEQFSWIFRIKDDIGAYVYPIHDLLDGVIEDAKDPTKENLIQLFFALQIYTQIDFDDKVSIRQKVNEIAQKYNIKILELLCNNGSFIGGALAGKNNLANQVLMVHDESYLIIRSTKKDYFGGETVQAEKNSKNEEIAWYIVLAVQENWRFCSLKEILLGSNSNAKVDVLLDVSSKSCYNVFFDKAFIVDRNDGRYLQITNQFKDKQIVESENKSSPCTPRHFWKIIGNSQNGIRGVILKQNRLETNILTIDFLAEFFANLTGDDCVQNTKYLECIKTLTDDEFYQNALFKRFIEENEKHGKIENALILYFNFIKKYVNPDRYDENTSMDLVPKLIMPYQIYVPCNGDIKVFFENLLRKEYFSEHEGNIVSVEIKKNKGKNLFYVDSHRIDASVIKCENEDDNINDYEEEKIWAINKNSHYILIPRKWIDTEKYLKKLHNIREESSLTKDIFLKDSNFFRIATIVEHTGFTDKLRKLYGFTNGTDCKALAIFKLYWHIQVFIKPGDEKNWFEKFKDLLLNKYYSNYVLNSDEWDSTFIKKIKELESNDVLFVGKESYGDGGTLSNIITKNITEDRSIIKWAIDAGLLNANLKNDAIYGYYLNIEGQKPKTISKIIFLTDNIISGSSTEKMLNYYFRNCKETERSYVRLNTTIDKILATNKKILGKDVEVEVRCIFALDDKNIPYGKSKVESENSNYSLKVNAMHLVPYNDYKVNENVGKIIAELYDKKFDSSLSNHAYVLRAHNMPWDKMLPDCMLKIETMGGLLQRKNEL
ncbi:hypothetical protein Fisuc_1296 [Fibrobacter succinogenes subsp. succinogenes S85]|uniref:Uncharacterized protein n=2 Tax=Fibrobacter succinogenes TaxID=833 RepID=A0ABN3YTK2_FIBSS|nr:hypothetical protein Fisuc_1296 [Fibrobacter succinogenes subsp. succinogenes S85]